MLIIFLMEFRTMAPDTPSEADFRILGLEPGAKFSEVRLAYLSLVKKWHPDRHQSQPYEIQALAEKKFREIDEAYRRISRNRQQPPRADATTTGTASRGPDRDATPRPKSHPRPASSRFRPAIAIRPFSGAKIILPILLFASLVFILVQFQSFFYDTVIDTEPLHVARNPTGEETQEAGQSAQPPAPESSEGLLSPAVPDLPPEPLPLLRSAPPNSSFTLGSTISEVLDIQGPPDRVHGQTWTYGLSEIQFKNGRVAKFNNFDGSLRVRMLPEISPDWAARGHITIGSTADEVLFVHGTPTRVEGDRWFYGFSELVFKNGRLAEYDNYFGNLKIILVPSALSGGENPPTSFTIGSTPDEVLVVQGTPTGVHGNRWSFNFAAVTFRDGKVYNVLDTEGSLRFTAPEQNAGDDGLPARAQSGP